MRVSIAYDYQELSSVATDIVVDLVAKKPEAVITMPAGGTPVGMYAGLVESYRRGKVDFSKVRMFDIDTAKVPQDDPHSHYAYIRECFVSKTDFDPDNWFVLDPMPDDVMKFCTAYDAKVRAFGGIDLVMDGLGHNGHFGYNEPGAGFASGTREVEIARRTREANARWYSAADEVPAWGMTMGVRTIMEAKAIVILVSGSDKAQIVRRVCEGPITEEVPMTVIRTHANARMIIDRDAAHLLTPDALRRISKDQDL